jgi:hypothetical protein
MIAYLPSKSKTLDSIAGTAIIIIIKRKICDHREVLLEELETSNLLSEV